MLVAFAVSTASVRAEPPRSRSLMYDPQSKDWNEPEVPLPGTPEGRVSAIKTQIRKKQYSRALREARVFKKDPGHDHPLYPQVILLEAEAQIGLKEFDKAHALCQAFLNEFGGMDLTDEALRLEFVIADAFYRGAKHKIWGGLIRVSGVDIADKIMDEISVDHPSSRMAEMAIKAKGDHLVQTGEHSIAEVEYSRLVRDYPKSRYRQFATARVAEAALSSFAGVEYDEAALIEAEERYKDYRSNYREAAERDGVGSILDMVHESRAEKEFRIGEYYERTDHVGTAVYYYANIRTQFAGTIAAGKATERLELLGALESTVNSAPAVSSNSREK
ncbi:MAG: hypothetical protein HYR83_10780 [Planctomycetes bacterium]|nr:hypothetical protein [Planctomycetota bacterium]